MRHVAANVLSLLIVAGVVGLAVFETLKTRLTAPGPAEAPVSLTIAPGERLGPVADRLEASGAIESAVLFRIAATYRGADRALKFGEYEIAPGASAEDILALITRGGNVQHFVTVPEGTTVHDAVARIMAEPLLSGEIETIPLEGTLLPETYAFSRGESRQAVVERMQVAMQEALEAAWAARVPDLPLTSPNEMLILASIVEKETRPNEHRKVASVFVNRLRRGMRLETDPTVIYGITLGKETLGRGLRRSELDRVTPYNTYQIDGLPPTPIANPGRASLEAVANPEETPYLFFVADGTGGHAFAETYAEHRRNVAAWRRIERQQNANQ